MGIRMLQDLTVGANAITPDQDSFNYLKASGFELYHRQGYYGQGLTWAVIDTGVKPTHPELVGQVLTTGRRFPNIGLPDNNTGDPNGHGTFVAAEIAGKLHGICPQMKILPVVPLDANGMLWSAQELFSALQYVIDWRGTDGKPVAGVNMSLGGSGFTNAEVATMFSLVQQLNDMGIPVITSAGNTGDATVQYPANLSNVIAVSAVDLAKLLASFSSFGPNIDLCQVGVNCLGADINSDLYVYMSGTSMAAPIVSGIMGLIICKDRILNAIYEDAYLTGRQKEWSYFLALRNASIDLGLAGVDNSFGTGFCTLNQKLLSSIIFAPGSDQAVVNGIQKTLRAPVSIYQAPTEKVTMVPIRDFADGFSLTTAYDNITKKTTVSG